MNIFAKTCAAATVAAALSAVAPLASAAGTINGAGSTFAYPIYAKWADTYQKDTGIGLNYQSIGSGGGIKQIAAKTVDFGASDMPLSPEKLREMGLMQFPTVMGGVVPIVNLPGIKPGEIKMTGPLLADIYLGKIKNWNDPALHKLNPNVRFPNQKITTVHRSDGSGTTYIFTHYLSKVSPQWKQRVGVNTAVNWPGGIGGKGSEGVSSYTQRIKGSIGYVEYAYALQNHMTYALMRNKSGHYVAPTSDTFQAAAANADWSRTKDFDLMLTDQPGAKSWPITGATFILMHRKQDKPEIAQETLKFFDWGYRHGNKLAEELDYVPMPPKVVKLIEKAWQKEVRTADGREIWTEHLVEK